jgi:hypothetical protein
MEEIVHLPVTLVQKPFVLRFSPEELRQQPVWSPWVDGIVLSNLADSPTRIGAKALQDSLLAARLGAARLIELDPAVTELPPELAGKRVIILGRPEDLALVRLLVEEQQLAVTDGRLNGDGFIIKPLQRWNADLVLVTSCVTRGVMYGAFELEERTTHRGVPRIDEAFVPAVRYRAWSFWNFRAEPPDLIGRSRYNQSIHYFADWPGVLAYPDYPELGGDKNTAARLQRQTDVHRLLGDATKFGATPGLIFNPFTYTSGPGPHRVAKEALARTHPEMFAQPFGPFGTDLSHPGANIHTLHRYNLCPSHPETRRFVEAGVRELVRTFPELGLLGLMFSDEGGELICGCAECVKRPYLDRIADYGDFIIGVARQENPNLRFMMFVHGINWWIALHQPEYRGREAAAIAELYRRANGKYDAMMMQRSTPTGGDLQSWLYPKSTLLGQGVPTFYYFHSYEAGGPGLVSPISSIMSHLSWPLPVYLEHLQDYLTPGSGMVGGSSLIAGMEVAWWHPQLDPLRYITNLSRAKYGDAAGRQVAAALDGTQQITEAFLLETKRDASESFTLYRWKPERFLHDYAGDRTTLKALAGEAITAAEGLAAFDFMVPQAKQPDTLAGVTAATAPAWRARFDITDLIAVADRAETNLAQALASQPATPDLQKLHRAAVATRSLTRLFRDYHLALVDANAARNTSDPAARQQLIARARTHLQSAAAHVVDYADTMLTVTALDRRPPLARFRLDVDRLYVGTPLCLVREAAYQFDEEFGGTAVTAAYDAAIAAKLKTHPPYLR